MICASVAISSVAFQLNFHVFLREQLWVVTRSVRQGDQEALRRRAERAEEAARQAEARAAQAEAQEECSMHSGGRWNAACAGSWMRDSEGGGSRKDGGGGGGGIGRRSEQEGDCGAWCRRRRVFACPEQVYGQARADTNLRGSTCQRGSSGLSSGPRRPCRTPNGARPDRRGPRITRALHGALRAMPSTRGGERARGAAGCTCRVAPRRRPHRPRRLPTSGVQSGPPSTSLPTGPRSTRPPQPAARLPRPRARSYRSRRGGVSVWPCQ